MQASAAATLCCSCVGATGGITVSARLAPGALP
jgi:hypothetical protein